MKQPLLQANPCLVRSVMITFAWTVFYFGHIHVWKYSEWRWSPNYTTFISEEITLTISWTSISDPSNIILLSSSLIFNVLFYLKNGGKSFLDNLFPILLGPRPVRKTNFVSRVKERDDRSVI